MRLDTIGVLIDILDEEYQNQLFSGAAAAARQHGARVVGFVGGALDGSERLRFGMYRNFIYDLATAESVDALLISAGTLVNAIGPERLATWCRRFEPLPLCTLSVPLPGIPCVSSDNAAGMRAAVTALLVQGGFTSIVCLRGPLENPEADARYDVYRSVLEQHGVPVLSELVAVGDFGRESAARAIDTLLDRQVVFRAIIASNDLMALGAIDGLLARGLRVPEDVAVIGFDDSADGRVAPVPLSTVRQSIYGLGHAGVELLLRRIHGEVVADNVVLPTQLITRRSCGLTPSVDAPDSIVAGDDLSLTLERRRTPLLARLGRFTAQAEPLFEVFARAVAAASPSSLLQGVIELVARDQALSGDTGGWAGAVSTLERELGAYAHKYVALAAFDVAFWARLRVSLAELGERHQAQRVLGMQRELAVLRRIGEGLLTSLDTERIMELLARELESLGLQSCNIALFEKEVRTETAELVLAWKARTPHAPPSVQRIPSGRLVPDTTRVAERPGNLIVQPLHFEHEQLGYAVFEMGPPNGTVYEILREQTSSAIKRARLVSQLIQQTALRERAEQRQTQKELEIAMQVQASILPRAIAIEGFELAASMLPVSVVGGDYYDVIPIDDGCWLGVGDVAGHGLQAGLVMLMMQSMLGALVQSQPQQAPSALVRAMNAALCRNVRERMGQEEHATLTLFRYQRDGRVRFAGAHEDIIVYRAATGHVELVPTQGMWVGIVPELDVEDSDLQLGDGDLIVLYTDGVTEARNPAKKLFGMERLLPLIAGSGARPVHQICERILHAVLQWSPVPEDDVTVLVARHRAAPSAART
jgi:DNA-binding LacI/PurR family transcriptional regulator/serine phosphatase RsbU (regulator of sigma subunit)